MTRLDFPTAVALAVAHHTAFFVTDTQVKPLALPLWDAAQDMARDKDEFHTMLASGTKTLINELEALYAQGAW